MRQIGTIVLGVLVAASLFIAARDGGTPSDAERTQRLSEELRCPVCDGLAVADSPSSTARAIAADVARRVEAGESDAAIRAAYVQQYGSWILLEPPADGVGAMVWLLPAALFVGAGAWTAHTLLRRRDRVSGDVPAASRALVAEAQARAEQVR